MKQTIKDWKVTISSLLVGITTYGITRSFGGWPFPKNNLINEVSNLGILLLISYITMIYISIFLRKKTKIIKKTKKRVAKKRKKK